MAAPGQTGWFLACSLTAADIAGIRFGNEGRDPQLLEIDAFLAADDGIAALQGRLRLLLASLPNDAVSRYHMAKTPLFP